MPSSEEYDHVITLLDSTALPPDGPAQLSTPPEPETPPGAPQSYPNTDLESVPSNNWLLKKGRARGDTIRKEWNKHKYARYQEGRVAGEEETETDSDDEELASLPDIDKGKGKATDNSQERIGTKARKTISHHGSRLRGRLPFQPKTPRKRKQDSDYAVDILYENQRGAFFCGIPLYSSRSLLNFDPAAWQTADFQDSAVNITNAQVPDPTWKWSWRQWYVDMSHDVDDEGWEYSLSFRQGFSWHGSQPWFTSFVRRRRWLRKRVRINPGKGKQHTMHEAHVLNPDYFTIHPSAAARDRSRGSSIERNAYQASTIPSAVPQDESSSEADDEDAEITNVAELLKRLKRTTVDRKKLDAFRNFLHHGGDELAYLPDNIEDILALFLYQNSRRQILLELEGALANARRDSEPGFIALGQDPEKADASEGPRRAGLSLRRAVDSIAAQVKELEYYSDIKAVSSPMSPMFKGFDAASIRSVARDGADHDGDNGSQDIGPDDELKSPTRESTDAGWRIKGIPEQAHVGENVGLAARIEKAMKQREESERAEEVKEEDRDEKGKERV